MFNFSPSGAFAYPAAVGASAARHVSGHRNGQGEQQLQAKHREDRPLVGLRRDTHARARVPSDPVLLPFDGDGLLIAGVKLQSAESGRKIWEHRQVWLCRAAVGTEADWSQTTVNQAHTTDE